MSVRVYDSFVGRIGLNFAAFIYLCVFLTFSGLKVSVSGYSHDTMMSDAVCGDICVNRMSLTRIIWLPIVIFNCAFEGAFSEIEYTNKPFCTIPRLLHIREHVCMPMGSLSNDIVKSLLLRYTYQTTQHTCMTSLHSVVRTLAQ